MTVLNEADDIQRGTTQVDAIYSGADKVWPTGVGPVPPVADGLTMWFDASDESNLVYNAGLGYLESLTDKAGFYSPPAKLETDYVGVGPDYVDWNVAQAPSGLPLASLVAGGTGMHTITNLPESPLDQATSEFDIYTVCTFQGYGVMFSTSPTDNVNSYVNAPYWDVSGIGVKMTNLANQTTLVGGVIRTRALRTASNSQLRILVNDATTGSTADARGNNFTGPSFRASLLTDNDGNEPCRGRFGETLVYNRPLLAGEQALVEAYLDEKWGINQTSGIEYTGGTVTTPGDGYKYHTFTVDGTLTAVTPGEVEYLVVAGSGGGGGGGKGGGGGAGGAIVGSDPSLATTAVTVGSGGLGAVVLENGADGVNSLLGVITAIGGGGGGRRVRVGNDGGSGGGGGGAAAPNDGGSGTAGQGFDGGDGINDGVFDGAGGGGGASEIGGFASVGFAGVGGDGVEWPAASGDWYGGGGGGGRNGAPAASGGLGGGADGSPDGSKPSAATANTGGGGGGSGSGEGGDGASGIVIVRYAI